MEKSQRIQQLREEAATLLGKIYSAHVDKRKGEVTRLVKELASLRDQYHEKATA